MPFISISSVNQFDQELPSGNVIIYYTADWCRGIAPIVDQIEKENPSIKVLKVDIDQLKDHPLVQMVSTVPHFDARKNGISINEFSGANESSLRSMVNQLV
ncbi:hypothetical protein CYY_004930 [Polysphondylium violaceum]|uniref:Thioredoxin domain-containing protein n=1 Tax=Polysphondylium violaceum TaxID=133409 RepID=A0A8J4PUK7_9MYCE|nr:hypothetical protein CYY_004930 [Polysphondylium violaceum]